TPQLAHRHVTGHPEGEALIEPLHQIECLDRKVQPLSAESDAAVTDAIADVVSQESADVREDLGIDRVMQPGAPGIEPLIAPKEASGVASEHRIPLEHGRPCLLRPAQLIRGPAPGGPAAEHDDVRLPTHAVTPRSRAASGRVAGESLGDAGAAAASAPEPSP